MPEDDTHIKVDLPYISQQIVSILAAIANPQSHFLSDDIRIQRLSHLGIRLQKFRQNVDTLAQCRESSACGGGGSYKYNMLCTQLVGACGEAINVLHDEIIRDLRPETLGQFDLGTSAQFDNYLDTNTTAIILMTQLFGLDEELQDAYLNHSDAVELICFAEVSTAKITMPASVNLSKPSGWPNSPE